MTKRIPLEFYNHLRNARMAKDRAHHDFLRAGSYTDYVGALRAYGTALAFRDSLEREQLNQYEEDDYDPSPCSFCDGECYGRDGQ